MQAYSKKTSQVDILNRDKLDALTSNIVKRATLEDIISQKFKTDRKESLLDLLKKDDLRNTLQKKKVPIKPLFKPIKQSTPQSQAFQKIQTRFQDMMAKARLSAPTPQLKLRSDLNKEEKINLVAKYKQLQEEIKKRIEDASIKVKSTEPTIRLRNRINNNDDKVGRISLPKSLISKSVSKPRIESSAQPKETLVTSTESSKANPTISTTTKATDNHKTERSNPDVKDTNRSEKKVSTAIEKTKTKQKESVSQIKSKFAEIMSKN
ncbi:uncharacterized protein LOC126742624 isoform X2 [Anthonomus grandis grandis]|uniref:uncharacterized protein LOC126742624 isoform X2 n=1 Tax=Anthonomus grandis grandis TaxID=2921223 RepID=UPI00216537FB|nr:uncharacterized protein LOC126742624 isoform X2 [Anthonomus grandis grandis]